MVNRKIISIPRVIILNQLKLIDLLPYERKDGSKNVERWRFEIGVPLKERRPNMELDTALQFAMIAAWEDLARVAELSSTRIEYRRDADALLDHLSVWSTRGRGYQDLVCDYWTWASPAHSSGASFKNGHSSDQLALSLDFIMNHQDQFARPGGTSRNRLILVSPPTESERMEAAAGMSGLAGGSR
jgi:hypothetical protein